MFVLWTVFSLASTLGWAGQSLVASGCWYTDYNVVCQTLGTVVGRHRVGMVLVCSFLVGCTGWRNGTCINCCHGTSVWRNRSVQVSLCYCNLELPNCGVSISVCKRCEISPSCIKIWSKRKQIQASYYYCCHCYGSVQDMESSVVSTMDISLSSTLSLLSLLLISSVESQQWTVLCHLHCHCCHYYRSAPWSLSSGHFCHLHCHCCHYYGSVQDMESWVKSQQETLLYLYCCLLWTNPKPVSAVVEHTK